MKTRSYLSRLPFSSEVGTVRYCVAGAMTDDAEADFQWTVDAEDERIAPTYCVDCSGELGSGELAYGPGARKCMQCGSVFRVVAGP